MNFKPWLETQIPLVSLDQLFQKLRNWINRAHQDLKNNHGRNLPRVQNKFHSLDQLTRSVNEFDSPSIEIHPGELKGELSYGIIDRIQMMLNYPNHKEISSLTPLEQELYQLGQEFSTSNSHEDSFGAMAKKGIRAEPKFALHTKEDEFLSPRQLRDQNWNPNLEPDRRLKLQLLKYYNAIKTALIKRPDGQGLLDSLEKNNGIYDPTNWNVAFDTLEDIDSRVAELRPSVMKTLTDLRSITK